MAWFPNWQERREWLERNGLPIIFEEARVQADGFVAIYLSADDAVLLRSNAHREWDLHITLGYASDYPKGVAELVRDQINAAWSNRFHVLIVEWVGEGAAAMIHAEDLITQDPLIAWAHRNGHYGNGLHTKPRQLHVSL